MQMHLPMAAIMPKAAYDYGVRSSGQTHGVVLTKPHVVDLILDLSGYMPDRDLATLTLLEPSCGTGAFLVRVLARLLASAKVHGRPVAHLGPCITGYDIDRDHVVATQRALHELLIAHGADRSDADMLVARWIREADFLLAPLPQFDVVVGNPPYVRIEQLPPQLQAEYRRRYTTLYDRADLYVAFIERGLQLLKQGGVLSFICADRWTLNKYGAPLRQLVTAQFGMRAYVDLHQCSPFESEVVAYPSIFCIGASTGGPVRLARLATASVHECEAASRALRGLDAEGEVDVEVHGSWFTGADPWVLGSPDSIKVLRDLEARFPAIEDDGSTRVRIGVATGADLAYIVSADVDVEPDRLVPLVMREDIVAGQVNDAARFVINTFGPGGKLIDLAEYPRLARYFDQFAVVRNRHVAKKNPKGWFRTIDRVYPELVGTPKLLVPDIAGANEVTYEHGRFHPHHNLYFVTSTTWDLEVLGGLLSSKMALFFVWSYAVKMRGGYLRFQAQYLRRIRVPRPGTLDQALTSAIKAAFRARDFHQLDALAMQAYGLEQLPAFDFVDTRS
jgi:adenine-specific DNA-methyltransferase